MKCSPKKCVLSLALICLIKQLPVKMIKKCGRGPAAIKPQANIVGPHFSIMSKKKKMKNEKKIKISR